VTTDRRPLVLIVDDEPDIAETYALRLESEYQTSVAHGGEEALELMDDDVDAVLLDRRMPDLHGDEVLERLRERGYGCPVVMITAVDPDLNILEMSFDDYLCKPIAGNVLADSLKNHLDTAAKQDERLTEFLSLVSKLDVLEAERTPAELAVNEEYQETKERAERLGSELRESVDGFDDLLDTYRDIARS
jgi:DNA-binding response OmpR family regulator